MRGAVLALVILTNAGCSARLAVAPPAPSAAPPTWHSLWKGTFEDVKTVVVDFGVMFGTFFGIVLITANGRRIWTAATNAALTINIPLVGNISLPARAAAELQADHPPPDKGLPPPVPGPIGHGTPPMHLVSAADTVVNLAASLGSLPAGQRAAALATNLLGNPATLAAMTVHTPEEVAFYRKFYAALFASQFDVLDSLNAVQPVTIGDAKSAYRASSAFGQPLSFASWLDYPRKYGMIDAVDVKNSTAELTITARGRDFLDWAASEGYGSGDLKAAGRAA